MRQPRTTGAPLRYRRRASARRSPSTAKKRTVSSMRDRPRDLAVAQDAGDGGERIFVFVPDAHFGRHAQAFAHRRFFEVRRDDGDVAFARHDGGGEPFAAPPLHAGEIHERCAGLDEQRADAELAHERAGLVDAREEFGALDGHDVARHRLERRRRVRGEQRGWARARPGRRWRRPSTAHRASFPYSLRLVRLVRLLFDDARA